MARSYARGCERPKAAADLSGAVITGVAPGQRAKTPGAIISSADTRPSGSGKQPASEGEGGGEEAQGEVNREEVECSVCCDIMVEPVRTSCDHVFCRECLSVSIM